MISYDELVSTLTILIIKHEPKFDKDVNLYKDKKDAQALRHFHNQVFAAIINLKDRLTVEYHQKETDEEKEAVLASYILKIKQLIKLIGSVLIQHKLDCTRFPSTLNNFLLKLATAVADDKEAVCQILMPTITSAFADLQGGLSIKKITESDQSEEFDPSQYMLSNNKYDIYPIVEIVLSAQEDPVLFFDVNKKGYHGPYELSGADLNDLRSIAGEASQALYDKLYETYQEIKNGGPICANLKKLSMALLASSKKGNGSEFDAALEYLTEPLKKFHTFWTQLPRENREPIESLELLAHSLFLPLKATLDFLFLRFSLGEYTAEEKLKINSTGIFPCTAQLSEKIQDFLTDPKTLPIILEISAGYKLPDNQDFSNELETVFSQRVAVSNIQHQEVIDDANFIATVFDGLLNENDSKSRAKVLAASIKNIKQIEIIAAAGGLVFFNIDMAEFLSFIDIKIIKNISDICRLFNLLPDGSQHHIILGKVDFNLIKLGIENVRNFPYIKELIYFLSIFNGNACPPYVAELIKSKEDAMFILDNCKSVEQRLILLNKMKFKLNSFTIGDSISFNNIREIIKHLTSREEILCLYEILSYDLLEKVSYIGDVSKAFDAFKDDEVIVKISVGYVRKLYNNGLRDYDYLSDVLSANLNESNQLAVLEGVKDILPTLPYSGKKFSAIYKSLKNSATREYFIDKVRPGLIKLAKNYAYLHELFENIKDNSHQIKVLDYIGDKALNVVDSDHRICDFLANFSDASTAFRVAKILVEKVSTQKSLISILQTIKHPKYCGYLVKKKLSWLNNHSFLADVSPYLPIGANRFDYFRKLGINLTATRQELNHICKLLSVLFESEVDEYLALMSNQIKAAFQVSGTLETTIKSIYKPEHCIKFLNAFKDEFVNKQYSSDFLAALLRNSHSAEVQIWLCRSELSFDAIVDSYTIKSILDSLRSTEAKLAFLYKIKDKVKSPTLLREILKKLKTEEARDIFWVCVKDNFHRGSFSKKEFERIIDDLPTNYDKSIWVCRLSQFSDYKLRCFNTFSNTINNMKSLDKISNVMQEDLTYVLDNMNHKQDVLEKLTLPAARELFVEATSKIEKLSFASGSELYAAMNSLPTHHERAKLLYKLGNDTLNISFNIDDVINILLLCQNSHEYLEMRKLLPVNQLKLVDFQTEFRKFIALPAVDQPAHNALIYSVDNRIGMAKRLFRCQAYRGILEKHFEQLTKFPQNDTESIIHFLSIYVALRKTERYQHKTTHNSFWGVLFSQPDAQEKIDAATKLARYLVEGGECTFSPRDKDVLLEGRLGNFLKQTVDLNAILPAVKPRI